MVHRPEIQRRSGSLVSSSQTRQRLWLFPSSCRIRLGSTPPAEDSYDNTYTPSCTWQSLRRYVIRDAGATSRRIRPRTRASLSLLYSVKGARNSSLPDRLRRRNAGPWCDVTREAGFRSLFGNIWSTTRTRIARGPVCALTLGAA